MISSECRCTFSLGSERSFLNVIPQRVAGERRDLFADANRTIFVAARNHAAKRSLWSLTLPAG